MLPVAAPAIFVIRPPLLEQSGGFFAMEQCGGRNCDRHGWIIAHLELEGLTVSAIA
jgi:hypothetical protein